MDGKQCHLLSLNSPSRTATHMDNTSRWRGPPVAHQEREETAFRPGPCYTGAEEQSADNSQRTFAARFSSRAQASRPASLAAWILPHTLMRLLPITVHYITLHYTLHYSTAVPRYGWKPLGQIYGGFDWDRAQTGAGVLLLLLERAALINVLLDAALASDSCWCCH